MDVLDCQDYSLRLFVKPQHTAVRQLSWRYGDTAYLTDCVSWRNGSAQTLQSPCHPWSRVHHLQRQKGTIGGWCTCLERERKLLRLACEECVDLRQVNIATFSFHTYTAAMGAVNPLALITQRGHWEAGQQLGQQQPEGSKVAKIEQIKGPFESLTEDNEKLIF